jgi:RNA polymerase sigma factor (sigma-70 family)
MFDDTAPSLFHCVTTPPGLRHITSPLESDHSRPREQAGGHVDPGAGHQEAMQQLREAIQHLPSEEKEVFLLRQNGELTYEQIARLDNRPVEVVKEQMRSALRKLRTVVH